MVNLSLAHKMVLVDPVCTMDLSEKKISTLYK